MSPFRPLSRTHLTNTMKHDFAGKVKRADRHESGFLSTGRTSERASERMPKNNRQGKNGRIGIRMKGEKGAESGPEAVFYDLPVPTKKGHFVRRSPKKKSKVFSFRFEGPNDNLVSSADKKNKRTWPSKSDVLQRSLSLSLTFNPSLSRSHSHSVVDQPSR